MWGDVIAASGRSGASLCTGCFRSALVAVERPDVLASLVRPPEVEHVLHQLDRRDLLESTVRWIARTVELRVGGSERWSSPDWVLRRSTGTAEDLAVLATSILRTGLCADVALGTRCEPRWDRCAPHAWVEGRDRWGWFLYDPSAAVVHRLWRPASYRLSRRLSAVARAA